MAADVRELETGLLGLEGFRLAGTVEENGEALVAVETTAVRVWCEGCGGRAASKGRRETKVRDLPSGGRPVVLVWRKRRWRCPEAGCGVKSWTETSEEVRSRSVLSERARREAVRQVGQDGMSVAAAARGLGVNWHTAMKAVREIGQPMVEAQTGGLRGVRRLGMDEHRWRKRPGRWATGFCDLDTGRLVEVVQGRSGAAARGFLGSQPAEDKASVQAAALDPWRGYLGAVRKELPDAAVTVDRFHMIRLANQALTEVRQRTQQETLSRRGRKGDPLYGIRRLLVYGQERLTVRQRHKLAAGLAAGDPYDEVSSAWEAKELLREVYTAPDAADARQRLEGFHRWARIIAVPEVERLSRTVRVWETETLNFHLTGITNGPTEALNLLIEKTRRIGHGYRNWNNYRLRLLLHCGVIWQTPRTKRIRGRKPPLAA